MSTSAQRTRRLGAHTKSALGMIKSRAKEEDHAAYDHCRAFRRARCVRLQPRRAGSNHQDRDPRPDGLRPGREPLGGRRDGARRDQQGRRHQRRRQAHAHRAGARRHQRDRLGARRHQRHRARDHARQGRLPDRRLPLGGGARHAGSGDGLQEAVPRRRRGAFQARPQRRAELRALQVLVPRFADQGRRPRAHAVRGDGLDRPADPHRAEDRYAQGGDPRREGGVDRGAGRRGAEEPARA